MLELCLKDQIFRGYFLVKATFEVAYNVYMYETGIMPTTKKTEKNVRIVEDFSLLYPDIFLVYHFPKVSEEKVSDAQKPPMMEIAR